MDDLHLFQVIILGAGFKSLLLSLITGTSATVDATFAPCRFGILTLVNWCLIATCLGGHIAFGRLGRPVELLCDVVIFLVVVQSVC